jgi:hypothetical protein
MLQDGRVEIEARGIKKDGTIFYKQVVMICAYDAQQQFVGHHCFMKDITDRKLTQAALQQQLQQTLLLKQITQQIRQSLDTKKIFECCIQLLSLDVSKYIPVLMITALDYQQSVDRVLYQAKSMGRDRIFISTDVWHHSQSQL